MEKKTEYNLHHLQAWLAEHCSSDVVLSPLPGDASFRQYYRFNLGQKSYIAVNAPPETENNAAFVAISEAFAQLNLVVPKVLAYDLKKGFLWLTDLGDNLLFHLLNQTHKDKPGVLYGRALEVLSKIQQCQMVLPAFDGKFMHNELALYEEWFLKKHLKLKFSLAIRKLLKKTFELLVESAVNQPQCCMHRDYHSRNLMHLPEDIIGILDFQDAMRGPITYDVVSLIRDCYIDWPLHQVMQWAENFHDHFLKQQIPGKAEFIRYFDFMGLQRHLKAIFIFARKFHRDQVDHYLKEIPRTLNYILQASEHYAELREFKLFIQDIYSQC